MNIVKGISLLAVLGLLAACGDEEVILPGERIDVRDGRSVENLAPETADVERAAFAMPAQVVLSEWTHENGSRLHRVEHPALGTNLTRVWSSDIGQGNSRRARITADPIVSGNLIYTLDSRALVSATSVNGERVWARDLVPEGENERDASGGGLAVSGRTVYVTSGFGTLTALDAATGAEKWQQDLGAPATASPTVFDDLVYIVSRDNKAWALDAGNGRVRWTLQGTPSVTGIQGGSGPAITDTYAVFPFSSGELVTALRQGGVRIWGSQVSGERSGRAYANITDIVADPVIAGDVVYTGNQSGRAVALGLGSGERLWTANEGAYGPVWVSGGSVFMISDRNELIRLDAETGARVWGTELPFYRADRARRREDIFVHYGPVLAGGLIRVASDDGLIRSYSPESGRLVGTADLPGGAASGMAVVNRTLYVVTKNGQLHAFR